MRRSRTLLKDPAGEWLWGLAVAAACWAVVLLWGGVELWLVVAAAVGLWGLYCVVMLLRTLIALLPPAS